MDNRSKGRLGFLRRAVELDRRRKELLDLLQMVDVRNHALCLPRVLQEAEDILHEKSLEEK